MKEITKIESSRDTYKINKNLKLNTVNEGEPTDNVLVHGSDNEVKSIPRSEFGGGIVDLDYSATPTGGTIFSSSGNDAIVPLATTVNAGLLSPEEKVKLEGFTITPDATTSEKGKLKLAGDLGGTADSPTTPSALHKTGNETKTGSLYVVSSAGNAALYGDNDSFGNAGHFSNRGTGRGVTVINGPAVNTNPVILSQVTGAASGSLYAGADTNGTTIFKVSSIADVTGNSFIKTGGSASQFLKADGSVDSKIYAPLSSPNFAGIPTAATATVGTNTEQLATTAFVLANSLVTPDATTTVKGKLKLAGDIGGTADLPTTPTAIHKTGNEAFTGVKSATNSNSPVNNGIKLTNNGSSAFGVLEVTNTAGGSGIEVINSLGRGMDVQNSGNYGITVINTGTGVGLYSVTSGTGNSIESSVGATSSGKVFVGLNDTTPTYIVDKFGNVTANSFIRTGGSPTQLLMADGSTNTVLSGSAVLNFPNIAAGGTSDLTITVTGAAVSDSVALGVDNASVLAGIQFTAWVSATNTVTIRCGNLDLSTAKDPASGTFKVKVFK
ncbi:hypothetical protein [Flavobacterium sp. PL02]|uniref:hypothetical protein n=1 Tax=Flavobacterium sp. PL02 TaxID=3088354 RepID=UPI002B22AF3E|nr:hypothetical protein [Flavobacterium sp. PL02]MEA9414402.1 hypothetical protein [Flavobacterium sp. PL02]